MPEMIVVSDISTNRLHYVLDYVFNMRLGIGYELKTLSDEVDSSQSVYYTQQPTIGAFCVPASGLLSESDVWQFTPDLKFDGDLPIIFSDNSGCTFKFDVFSAIFWMLSRYEEYLPFLADEHGRFSVSESFVGRNQLLDNPIVDRWVLLFRTELHKAFPSLQMKTEAFEFQPTIDVDSPWSYLHKGMARNVGGLFRDLLKFDFRSVAGRLLVLAHIKPDTFFTFAHIDALHRNLPLKYFMLISSRGRYDKSISPKNRAFRKFVADFCSTHNVGLHPSYQASVSDAKFTNEIADYKAICKTDCTQSRQHFLRIVLPQYYQMLERQGITDDYSMGYAENVGFRAGTSRPFRFFDLQNNRPLNVVVHPLTVMDVTLKNYLNLTPDQAVERLRQLAETVHQTNGVFVSLWHNQHFCQNDDWKAWDCVYAELLKMVED